MANQLDSDSQMLELLRIIQLDNDGSAYVVFTRIYWQLHDIFVGVLHFPEFIASRWIQQHIDGYRTTEAEQGSDFILRQGSTLPYLRI